MPTHADNPPPTRNSTPPTFVASVRPFDNNACADNHPLARVHYGRGMEFTSWQYVRHEHLEAETGHCLAHWERIDAYAATMCSQIAAMVAAGQLPPITDFAELHDHFDANAGWGEFIDTLPPGAWSAVQWRVTARLRWE